jgi:hypothetical protein
MKGRSNNFEAGDYIKKWRQDADYEMQDTRGNIKVSLNSGLIAIIYFAKRFEEVHPLPLVSCLLSSTA